MPARPDLCDSTFIELAIQARQNGNDAAFAVPAYGTADFRAIWNDAQKRYSVIGFVKNAFDKLGYTSTGSTNPTATYGLGAAGLTQDGVAITRGLIYPRTYGVELQYRFF